MKVMKDGRGDKLAEISVRTIDIVPRSLKYAEYLMIPAMVVGICINLIIQSPITYSLIAVLICNIIVFFIPRKIEIYEKGIATGIRFIDWDDVREYGWEDGILRIKARRLIGRCIELKDEDGRIKDIVKQYLGEKR